LLLPSTHRGLASANRLCSDAARLPATGVRASLRSHHRSLLVPVRPTVPCSGLTPVGPSFSDAAWDEPLKASVTLLLTPWEVLCQRKCRTILQNFGRARF